jgi:hypothetical protein
VCAARFHPDLLAGHDEPVGRYFAHAIGEGSPLGSGVALTMAGRIKVGIWMPFTAEQVIDGRSFCWEARVGRGPIKPLRVVDRYADGQGSTEGRLLGRIRLFRDDDTDTARSAATRTALESVAFAPASLLPGSSVSWRAEDDDLIVARFDLPPEHPEVRVRIDGQGAVRDLSALRWGNAGLESFGYIPCGCEVHSERRFGGLTLPSSISVGWWFGTARYEPFFRATLVAVANR